MFTANDRTVVLAYHFKLLFFSKVGFLEEFIRINPRGKLKIEFHPQGANQKLISLKFQGSFVFNFECSQQMKILSS